MKFRFQTVKTANNSNPTANIRKKNDTKPIFSKNLSKKDSKSIKFKVIIKFKAQSSMFKVKSRVRRL